MPNIDAIVGLADDDGASRKHRKSTRKETILSLVEMLLREDSNSSQEEAPILEDDKDVPTVDEHLQAAGADTFHRFHKRINNLDKELRNFANAARQLGSSAAILSSAFHLRERLAHLLHLYRENAADLFPRKITHATHINIVEAETPRRLHRRAKPSRPPQHFSRPVIDENLDLEDFPDQFEALAKDVTTFMNCLNEFPEFTDEAVNASISAFEGDLKYWASCLRVYQGQFRYPAVQRYIHDLTSEMGEHIDSITSTLSMFIEIGVPTIRFAQKHGATNLLNLSTVATFFSAVTATTMQFSFELQGSTAAAVNSFWFASLVFSIAAAVNSLLGLTWKQAMYRSPGHRVPWWVLIWIKRSPLVFLVMSVACFSIGLCCFAYASNQHHVTSTITTVFTAFTSFGLCAVSAWFASERWTFLRHSGRKWLSDVLLEGTDKFLNLPGMDMIRFCIHKFEKSIERMRSSISKVGIRTVSMMSHGSASGSDDSEKHDDIETGNGPILPLNSPPNSPTLKHRGAADPLPETNGTISPTPTSPTTEGGAPSIYEEPSVGKQLWKNAIRTVKMRSAVSSNIAAMASARNPNRQRTASSTLNGRKRSTGNGPLLRSRVATLTPQLRCLQPTRDLTAHQALVKHMQFSPNGKFLATSSWDRTSLIFRVGDTFESHRILAHAKGFVNQVAWAPSGNLLLTKLSKSIKIWTEDGVCLRTIDRPDTTIESITWLPDGTGLLSVEGSQVTKLDLLGKVVGEYVFENMKLHDVAVTPDGLRLLGIGPLTVSPTGLKPSKPRAVEKRLAVYNTQTNQIEHQTPVLNDVRDITLARNTKNGLIALVSYEYKAPPQLWKIDIVKDHRDNNAQMVARFTLRHTYMPKGSVEFAGPSYFGGKNDELVLCAGKAGDIHIWDQESGALLHYVRAQALGGDLTCIAWNPAAEDPYMFATGSHDGAVRIWTRPQPEPSDNTDNGGGSANFTPRTASPMPFEMDRTDSPLSQRDFDEMSMLESDSDLPLRERMVAFATDRALRRAD
ncbi:WD40 repeat-like protein [Armillaria gallica]|uniref:WD40 repeat-like protein n=1 Tax=Armillaria gallica TaxID=47427 RepID=A0A2H3D3K1_ARMGA|nr:WD40 repeat-like protein [Armillaria gallica]